jgi:MFS family permease
VSLPTPSSLWRNDAFVRFWAAATISIFGSLITRIALPLIAILTLGAGALEVAVLRSVDLIAVFAVGLVAGAWVDRLRRRPVLIWADIIRAVVLLSIPIAFALDALTLAQLVIVAALTAVVTTFFDAADNAYLPTIVERERLVEANGALAASTAVSESLGFGLGGFLVQALSGPLTILINTVSYLVSAVLLFSVRKPEPPPPPREDREPVLDEIRHGLRVVRREPILRAFVVASMVLAAMHGINTAVWFVFALTELGLDAASMGIVAGIGGVASFVGAVLAQRTVARFGIGWMTIVGVAVVGVGYALVPLAPVGLPLLAIACLAGQQILTDLAETIFSVGEVSVRQAIVPDRELGRVASTFRVSIVGAQLIATLAAGVLATIIGVRLTATITPILAIVGCLILLRSPVRSIGVLTGLDRRAPREVVADVQPDVRP